MSWVKIKNALMTRAVNHPQVNSFGTGDPLAIGTDNVINLRTSDRDRIAYPLVFADVISAQAGDPSKRFYKSFKLCHASII